MKVNLKSEASKEVRGWPGRWASPRAAPGLVTSLLLGNQKEIGPSARDIISTYSLPVESQEKEDKALSIFGKKKEIKETSD